MSFCALGKDYIKDGYTQIDNVFILSYLPKASATDVKVYLYGLCLAESGSKGSIEEMALSLKIAENRIIEAFKYWEEQGIVTLSKTHPVEVTYRSVKQPLTPAIKINAREYSVFVEEMARLFPDKVLTPNEITAFVELMKEKKIEVNAMLMTAKYCTDIRAVSSTPYILAVASDWADKGVRSEGEVTNHIEELERNSEDIRSIFRTLGIKSEASLDDRQLYLKWTKEYGYQMDAILTAARSAKRRGGMNRLSSIIEEIHSAGAVTAAEASAYLVSKEESAKLAESVVKALGTYYSSYDMVIDTYINPWKMKGFDEGAIKTVARFCFLRNIKTLDAMSAAVDKFYKMGILTSEGIDGYIEKQLSMDKGLRKVLESAGASSFISSRDREYYRTFIEDWGFSEEIILLAAEASKDKPFPMSVTNRTLASLKEKNITTVAEAEKEISAMASRKKETVSKDTKGEEKSSGTMHHQTYTREQLRSVFLDFDSPEKK